MTPRYHFGLLVLAALLVPMTLHANRIPPTTRPLPGPVRTMSSRSLVSPCVLGVAGPAASVVSYVLPPDDQYFTYLDPEQAGCTGSNGIELTAAHIQVEFPYALDTPVLVGIVRANLDDGDCPAPRRGEYLFPPTLMTLSGPGTGAYDIALPLPAGCTIEEPAFLEITFTEWGPWWEVPSLLITSACEPCRSYNYYPGDGYDLCTFGFEGNPVMYVEGSPVSVVPVAKRTWGRLKTLYR